MIPAQKARDLCISTAQAHIAKQMPTPSSGHGRGTRRRRWGSGRAVSSGRFILDVNSGAQTLTYSEQALALLLRSTSEGVPSPHAVSAHPLPGKPGRWLSRYPDKRRHRRRGVRRYSFRTRAKVCRRRRYVSQPGRTTGSAVASELRSGSPTGRRGRLCNPKDL